MSENSGEQTIVCQGCGSNWLINSSNKVQIVARLVECPLCEPKWEGET
jgi:hypothetical protein